MAGRIGDIHIVDHTSFPYIFEQNVSVPLKSMANPSPEDLIRCNIYRPKPTGLEMVKGPVLVTYGPYGKDIHYKEFVLPGHGLVLTRRSWSSIRIQVPSSLESGN